jgi:hypothetical protein
MMNLKAEFRYRRDWRLVQGWREVEQCQAVRKIQWITEIAKKGIFEGLVSEEVWLVLVVSAGVMSPSADRIERRRFAMEEGSGWWTEVDSGDRHELSSAVKSSMIVNMLIGKKRPKRVRMATPAAEGLKTMNPEWGGVAHVRWGRIGTRKSTASFLFTIYYLFFGRQSAEKKTFLLLHRLMMRPRSEPFWNLTSSLSYWFFIAVMVDG